MALNQPGALASPTPANISDMCASATASVSAQPAAAAAAGDDGGDSSSPLEPWPRLVLDSGAGIHAVGDATLLSNLRNAPAGMRIRVANGETLPVSKIGDIEMTAAGLTIPEVHLAPGLKSNLISVRVLTRRRIYTWFDGDRAMLYAGRDLVGVAVAPPENRSGVYVLESLSMPEIAATESGKLVPVWCGYSACGSQSTSGGASLAHTVSSIRGNRFGSMSSICKNSLGSMLCWLKALPHATPLFGPGPEAEEKRIQELHVSDQRVKRRRTEGDGDSCLGPD